ncbi:MAG: outer membrane protein assembly factor BamD, partial [Planctomycetes bacterium]|nr:outer membrane protein assembly factor BamD [Planctomycetota bacterium]
GPRYDSQSLQEAEVRYRQFRAEFPESIHDDEIVDRLRRLRDLQAEKEFEIASFYHRTGKHPAAQYYWQTITETWPTSDWARQSEAMLQKFQ